MNLAFTIGDCNGIGTEVLLKAIVDLSVVYFPENLIHTVIYGKKSILVDYAGKLNIPVNTFGNGIVINRFEIGIYECESEVEFNLGKISRDAGKLAAEAITKAAESVLAGSADAMITMPISKKALHLAGIAYPGHTEMIAVVSKSSEPLMILCHENMRVGLVTAHKPLLEAVSTLSQSGIIKKATIFFNTLTKDFCIAKPRLAVLGLNPHAGESGDLGTEEIEIIQPAMEKLRQSGIPTEGPFPADGFFTHDEYKNFDGILAMYHDQGLIPLKLLAQGKGVNFTAGLPIVRTSPDHGTAFGIAGKGIANPDSTIASVKLAVEIVRNRKKF